MLIDAPTEVGMYENAIVVQQAGVELQKLNVASSTASVHEELYSEISDEEAVEIVVNQGCALQPEYGNSLIDKRSSNEQQQEHVMYEQRINADNFVSLFELADLMIIKPIRKKVQLQIEEIA